MTGLGRDRAEAKQGLDSLLARRVCTRQTDLRGTRRANRELGKAFLKNLDRADVAVLGPGARTRLPGRDRA